MEWLNWSASILGMIAAIMVSLNAGARVTGYGFVIFTVSSVLWIIAAFQQTDNALALQNIVLFGINLFGIYRWLWRKAD